MTVHSLTRLRPRAWGLCEAEERKVAPWPGSVVLMSPRSDLALGHLIRSGEQSGWLMVGRMLGILNLTVPESHITSNTCLPGSCSTPRLLQPKTIAFNVGGCDISGCGDRQVSQPLAQTLSPSPMMEPAALDPSQATCRLQARASPAQRLCERCTMCCGP